MIYKLQYFMNHKEYSTHIYIAIKILSNRGINTRKD